MIERKKMKRGRNTEKDMDTERKVQQKERKEMDTKNTGPYNKKLKTVLQRTIINEKADARNMTESTDDEDIDEQQDNTNNKEQQDKDKDMEGKSTYIAKLIKDQGLDISDSDEETSDRTNIPTDYEDIADQVDNTNSKEQKYKDKDNEGKSNSDEDSDADGGFNLSAYQEQQDEGNEAKADRNKTFIATTPQCILTDKMTIEKKLQMMAAMQCNRIILNVGSEKFETCIQTLENDPKGLLAKMIAHDSPMASYKVNNINCYFIDRDPRYFRFVLNYLRNINTVLMARLLSAEMLLLEELLVEAKFYQLAGLEHYVERKLRETNQRLLQE
ncbi:uncharacterized protein LOC117333504 isoform X1 [Pecten maximus]|uniref:uncharacterized protein LOC117333504 isoform X1 n=1 Tax=Pecten maximus TaxID=6579 RepID=UPI001458DA4C|nr:uncharacterized protein LOC117333504 isoform X1 [Pecten maximus]XP_033748713.1 uncharacterized protein LOC117333504 isoform X1 [Pecten maximus]XP_033748714.1 uncharacterized protein LOC117333504 isoform X1 [Pecten maximus]